MHITLIYLWFYPPSSAGIKWHPPAAHCFCLITPSHLPPEVQPSPCSPLNQAHLLHLLSSGLVIKILLFLFGLYRSCGHNPSTEMMCRGGGVCFITPSPGVVMRGWLSDPFSPLWEAAKWSYAAASGGCGWGDKWTLANGKELLNLLFLQLYWWRWTVFALDTGFFFHVLFQVVTFQTKHLRNWP